MKGLRLRPSGVRSRCKPARLTNCVVAQPLWTPASILSCSTSRSEVVTKAHKADAATLGITAKSIFTDAFRLFKQVAWPAVWLYLASEAVNMLLNRCTHRLVNALFLLVQGGAYTPDMIGGSLWFLSLNPAITTFETGYNYISYTLIALNWPVSALFGTAFILALYQLAWNALQGSDAGAASISATASVQPAAVASPSAPADAATAWNALSSTAPSAASAAASVEGMMPSQQATALSDQRSAAAGVEGASGSGAADQMASSGNGAGNGVLAAGSDLTGTSGAADARVNGGDGSAAATPAAGVVTAGEDAGPGTAPIAAAAKQLRFAAIRDAFGALAEVFRKYLKPVFVTSFVAGTVEKGMIFLSILVITLPYTIPQWLGVQLAVPIARFEGLKYKEALAESRRRLTGLKRPFGLAVIVAFVGHMLMIPLQVAINQLMSPRIALLVPELPITVLLSTCVAKFVLLHLQWLLPVVLYFKLLKSEPSAGEVTGL